MLNLVDQIIMSQKYTSFLHRTFISLIFSAYKTLRFGRKRCQKANFSLIFIVPHLDFFIAFLFKIEFTLIYLHLDLK
jgi:hypothetical protein